jgi:hypothetical protein
MWTVPKRPYNVAGRIDFDDSIVELVSDQNVPRLIKAGGCVNNMDSERRWESR